MTMKKRLILILNGKDGVGKSFFAANFIQYLKDHEISHEVNGRRMAGVDEADFRMEAF